MNTTNLTELIDALQPSADALENIEDSIYSEFSAQVDNTYEELTELIKLLTEKYDSLQ